MLHLLNGRVAERDVSMSSVEIEVDANGRVLLPDDARRQLGIVPGARLLLEVTDDGILMWPRAGAARSLTSLVSRSVPASSSLVDELNRMCRSTVPSVREQVQATPLRSRDARR